jgi:hypothetical protein
MATADMPEKNVFMQTAMRRHFSQSLGAGAFDGQQGMPLAISSVADPSIADPSIVDGAANSSGIAAITPAGGASAMTGRDNGANATPAITTIAASWRMVIRRFISPKSHMRAQIESLSG